MSIDIQEKFRANIQVLRLWPKDGAAYAEIRKLSLEESPNSFAYLAEDEASMTAEDHGRYIDSCVVIGAKYKGFANEPLVGIVSLCTLPGRLKHMCELTRLYVHPDFRGQGVSNALMERFYSEARTHWMDGCKLSVAETNAAAYKFYQRHGFEVYGRLDEEFNSTDGRVAGVHMIKRLTSLKVGSSPNV